MWYLMRLGDWLWVLALIGIFAVSVILYIRTNPNFFYSFVVGFLVGIVFLIVTALRPKYKEGLIKRLSGLRRKDIETGGWFNRYGRLAGFLIIMNSLVFRLLIQYKPISPIFFLLFIYIQISLGVILCMSLIKIVGKLWRYLLTILIILGFAVAIIVTALSLLELLPH